MSQDEPDKDKRILDKRTVTVPATASSSGVKDTPLGWTERWQAGKAEVDYVGVPHCEVGKEPIKEGDYHLCTICERPMCKAHAIFYEDRPYCQKHAHKASDIVKLERMGLKDAQVLICLHNRIFGVGDIRKLARITEDDVRVSLANLSKHGFVRRESAIVFIKFYELTMEGAEAMPLLYTMHKRKGAMTQFVKEATAWMERKGRPFSLPEPDEEPERKENGES